MTSTKGQNWQDVQDSALPVIGAESRTTNEVIMQQVDQHLDHPVRLFAALPPDSVLYVGASTVVVGDTANRTMGPIDGSMVESPQGSIDYQDIASPVGTITLTRDGAAYAHPVAAAAGEFVVGAFVRKGDGSFDCRYSDVLATLGAVEAINLGPYFTGLGGQPVGYIYLESTDDAGRWKTPGSATDIIENSYIFRFGAGAGGGSNSFQEVEILDNQSVAVDVDGLVLDSGANNAVHVDYSLRRVDVAMDDETFHTNIGTGFDGQARSLAVQSDGKILVGGLFTTLDGVGPGGLVRLLPDGSPDATFLTALGAGFATMSHAGVVVVATQADGKILVGGEFTSLDGDTDYFRLVRLEANGSVDVAFTTAMGTGFSNGTVSDLCVLGDGKIVVGGSFTTFDGNSRNRLICLNSDGTEFVSFYTNHGGVTGGNVATLALQQDGKILVGGTFTTLDVDTRNGLFRLNGDGTEDGAFYTNIDPGFSSAVVLDVAVQADGKIVVVGGFTSFAGNGRARMVRLELSGAEDTAFYTNLGAGFTPDPAQTLAIQPDGKIIVGGSFSTFNSNPRGRFVRLNADGTEDTRFYLGLGTAFSFTVQAIVVLADGDILVSGDFTQLNGEGRGRLAKVSQDPITERARAGRFSCVHRPSFGLWDITGETYAGDDAGVTFSADGDQIQYTSDAAAGDQTEGVMRYILTKL